MLIGSRSFGPRGKLRGTAAIISRSVLSATALIAIGCSSQFPVLIKVDPSVDRPKQVDIVWILTDSPDAQKQIFEKFRNDMPLYFQSRSNLIAPGQYSFYRFSVPGQSDVPDKLPLEVTSDPVASRLKYWGPFEVDRPKNAREGYLYVWYPKDQRDVDLPRMIYPRLQGTTYYEYASNNKEGISILIAKDKLEVIPYPKESQGVIDEAKSQNPR